ncbi:NUDIX domain-containing protein [Roseiarcaceae bacterium H3SJ34-1]|uniref:NUDIX domain-containing protein n=1 Tax=Terripilifer ovatus TaxID=3032367 RepID=UPI003AB95699|nr:NUDIX domain-containing protein [Roseiarcaceae bacterium H3SJ34-1]
MSARILEVRTIYEGWGKFLKAKIQLVNGEIVEREIEDHGRAVVVLPYDPERRVVILVRQMRSPLLLAGGEPHSLEAPAGSLAESDPEVCARREALEEAGLRLETLEPVVRAWAMPGVSTEQLDMFLAPFSAADRIAPGGGLDDEQEYIEVVELACSELAAMIASGRMLDLKTLTLALTLQLRHPYLFE